MMDSGASADPALLLRTYTRNCGVMYVIAAWAAEAASAGAIGGAKLRGGEMEEEEEEEGDAMGEAEASTASLSGGVCCMLLLSGAAGAGSPANNDCRLRITVLCAAEL